MDLQPAIIQSCKKWSAQWAIVLSYMLLKSVTNLWHDDLLKTDIKIKCFNELLCSIYVYVLLQTVIWHDLLKTYKKQSNELLYWSLCVL